MVEQIFLFPLHGVTVLKTCIRKALQISSLCIISTTVTLIRISLILVNIILNLWSTFSELLN